MAFTPLVSQPNCNLLSGSHNRSLPVLSLAVETGEALVLEVLDVHGLLYDPGHRILVLGQHSDLELGWSSIVFVNLVVIHEGIILLFHIRILMFNSS